MSLCLLKTWARDWRRAASVALGIVLAVSLFVGINMSLDLASYNLVGRALDRVLADIMVFHSPEGANWTEVRAALRHVKWVVDVVTIARAIMPFAEGFSLLVNGEPLNLTEAGVEVISLYGLPEQPTRRLRMGVTEGTWNLSGPYALLPAITASDLGIRVGDEIAIKASWRQALKPGLVVEVSWQSEALEVRGLLAIPEDAELLLSGQPMASGLGTLRGAIGPLPRMYRHVLLIFMSVEKLVELLEDLAQATGRDVMRRIITFVHYAWVDREAIVDPWNMDATTQRLDDLEVSLSKALADQRVSIHIALTSAIRLSTGMLNAIKVIAGIFSLPVFVLCWYLALTAGFLVSSARRREIGLLRVRGASSRRIFVTYMATSALMGLLGGFLGALVGIGIGLATASLAGIQVPWSVLARPLESEALAAELGLGVGLCLLAGIKPARFASKLSPLEAAREYVEAEAVGEWRPGKLTIVALILGCVKMGEWLAGVDMLEVMQNMPPTHPLVMIFLGIWAFFDAFVLTFLGPLLFVYGLTKLVTRSSKRLYEIASLLAKPLGQLRELVSRSLARNPARASRVALLISVAVAYGLFTSVLAASLVDAHSRLAHALVGSDVRVEVAPDLGFGFAGNLTGLEGVEAAAPLALATWVETEPLEIACQCVVVGASPLSSIIYSEPGFCEPEFRSALAELENSTDKVLVSSALAERLRLEVGDEFYIRAGRWIEGGQEPEARRVTVAGILEFMPGLMLSIAHMFLMVMDDALAEELDVPLERLFFLLRVEPGSDPEEVARAVEEAFPDDVYGTTTVEEVLSRSFFMLISQPICELLRTGFAYSLAAASLGLGLTAVLNVRERTYEIGLMRARGLRRKQVLLLLAAEALIVAVIGLAIGILTGLVSASGVLSFLSKGGRLFGGMGWPIEVRLIVPFEAWALLVAGGFLFVLASALPALAAFRREVVETIRFR